MEVVARAVTGAARVLTARAWLKHGATGSAEDSLVQNLKQRYDAGEIYVSVQT